MRGQETFLAKFFHSTKPLVVPVYQRNYTWRKENCKLLFDDILSICNDNHKKHFIGSVVFVDHADSFIVIDGQQRITTISILLLALRNAIKNGEIEVSNPSLANQIEYEFLVNQFSSTEEHRMKLKPFRLFSTMRLPWVIKRSAERAAGHVRAQKVSVSTTVKFTTVKSFASECH